MFIYCLFKSVISFQLPKTIVSINKIVYVEVEIFKTQRIFRLKFALMVIFFH